MITDEKTCGNCEYMFCGMDKCWCEIHREKNEIGDTFATECPEAFTCNEWVEQKD